MDVQKQLRRRTVMNRREVLKSTFGALALASGIAPAQNAMAQTRRRAARTGPATPDFARLSNAVLNSHGHAAASVWNGTNTGTLKSDDLVKASLLLRLTVDHFGEIGVNTYFNSQLSQPPSDTSVTVSPNVVHAIGERIRSSYDISITDAQIQSMYPADANAIEQGRLYLIQVGIPAVQLQIADSLDLAAKKLRLQEIATACGALLPLLPSSLHPTDLATCSDLQTQINSVEVQHNIAEGVALGAIAGCALLLLDPLTAPLFFECEDAAEALEAIADAYMLSLILLKAQQRAQNCI
jgi:hypothetical protein